MPSEIEISVCQVTDDELPHTPYNVVARSCVSGHWPTGRSWVVKIRFEIIFKAATACVQDDNGLSDLPEAAAVQRFRHARPSCILRLAR